jgi:hypothetical protein
MTTTYADQPVTHIPCNVSVGSGLRTVKLAPWGVVESKSGRFIIDQQAVDAILAAFNRQAVAVPVDIEHETLPGREPVAGSRGAVGWIEQLWAEPGKGLFAFVRYNARGLELIRSGAFGYVSPVFIVNKADRRAVELHSMGLTTKPAIGNQERLAASARLITASNGDRKMKTIEEVKTFIREQILTDEWDDGSAPGVLDMLAERMIEFFGAETAEPEAMSANSDVVALKRHASSLEREVLELRQTVADQELDAFLAPFIQKGVLHPDSKFEVLANDYREICDLARLNRSLAEKALKDRVANLPPQGKTTPPKDAGRGDSRGAVILAAKQEFQREPAHERITNARAFISMRLRDKGLEALSNEECTELSIS